MEEIISYYKTKTEFKDNYLLKSLPEVLNKEDKEETIKQFHEYLINYKRVMTKTFRKLKQYYK